MLVKLRVYTTEKCPVYPWDEIIGPEAVGKNYTVLGINSIPYEGIVYNLYVLERINESDPGPGLYWPTFAAIVV